MDEHGGLRRRDSRTGPPAQRFPVVIISIREVAHAIRLWTEMDRAERTRYAGCYNCAQSPIARLHQTIP